jgi:fluoroquinolone transport system ATP-binding protein
MIKVNNIYHSYTKDDNYAVKNVSFEVKKGEIFGFLGPSGAGKSTTQNILIGLLKLQQGEVFIEDKDIKKFRKEIFNKIGVSFEQPNVYKKLTGLENLKFHASMYNVPTKDPVELLTMVGLEDSIDKRAEGYSKGMLQRLVFARSMINNPSIWFLDEPTSGLDPTTAAKIKDVIKEKQNEGTTIFLTTHNMQIADELCDRVAFITDGEISTIDSPVNLKLKYGQRLIKITQRTDSGVVEKRFSVVDELERKRIKEIIDNNNFETMHSQEATLEEIFIKVTGQRLE